MFDWVEVRGIWRLINGRYTILLKEFLDNSGCVDRGVVLHEAYLWRIDSKEVFL
jgi:hypothetical protein